MVQRNIGFIVCMYTHLYTHRFIGLTMFTVSYQKEVWWTERKKFLTGDEVIKKKTEEKVCDKKEVV